MQECNTCNVMKNYDQYYCDKRRNTYQKRCKSCCAKKKREQYHKDILKSRTRQNTYRENNRDKYNSYMVTYRKDNQNKIRSINQKWYYENGGKEKKRIYDKGKLDVVRVRDRERYNTDVQFRLRKVLRTRISKFVKKKNHKSSKLLNCTFDLYTEYLEHQFDKDMTWDNYGEYWNIDHIIPCSYFDLKDPYYQKICFHWSNTRPMIKSKNESKNNTIDEIAISNHCDYLQSLAQIKFKSPIPSYTRKGIMAQISELRYGNNSADELSEMGNEMGKLAAKS